MTYDLISVDDHILEPPHVWTERLPEKFREVGPHVETNEDGTEQWVYEGRRLATVGLFATVGQKAEDFSMDPVTYADMRQGCYDPVARAADMDTDGIRASLCFPTFPRTCGQTFLEADDRELAELCVRAWNDFVIDEWCSSAPGRFIPQIIGMLWDPDLFATELRRCAERGAKAVSFSENPAKLGLPSFHSPHWDPVWRACEESGIVVCLHIGSSSVIPKTADDAPFSVTVALSPMNAQSACTDLILSRVPQEFPDIRIALSEGGVGWVPFALEHSDYVWEKHKFHTKTADAIRPSEAFRRNFWVCFIDEDFGLRNRHDVGVDRIMWECDYPHSDTSWPNSQANLAKTLTDIPDDEVAAITHGNAEKLFGLA